MIRIFTLYEIFYYMIFTQHSAGKIWSSICMQDIVKLELHDQINLIGLMLFVFCIRFIWQINLMKIIIYNSSSVSDENNYL